MQRKFYNWLLALVPSTGVALLTNTTKDFWACLLIVWSVMYGMLAWNDWIWEQED